METEREVSREMRALYLLWACVLGSLGLYLAVGLYLAPSWTRAALPEGQTFIARAAAYLFTGTVLLIARYIRYSLFKKKRESAPLSLGQEAVLLAAQRYLAAMMAVWFLSEAIAIGGLALSALTKNSGDLFLLLLVSALALCLWRPRDAELLLLA